MHDPEMNLVDTLLRAIIRQDADAMILHVGDPPYIMAPSGTVELSARPLTEQSLSGLVTQLLPPQELRTLNELGTVEHALEPDTPDGERFIVVATRSGDDVWVELRRQRRIAPAKVVQLTRSPVREQPPPVVTPPGGSLERLLKIAAARGASALYVTPEAPPLIRVDGEMVGIDGEDPLDLAAVESFLFELAPPPQRDKVRRGNTTQWLTELPEVGRVRCTTFHDTRGPGAVFQMISPRAIPAEQLGLSREIVALADAPDGFVLVTGPRASGKSTLVAAFVEMINRRRAVHVITIEPQLKVVHENRRAFVSQREVGGGPADVLAAFDAALREDPDVIVLEELRTPELAAAAIAAADAGRLVLATATAPGATAAIDRLLDRFPAERRREVQAMLSSALRAVVGQTLVRRKRGGRVAARELLLSTPAVASLIAEGKTFQLARAIESGQHHGMLPLNEALAALVRKGVVEPHEAYRSAYDRDGLVSRLQRDGVDTSNIQLLA